MSLRDQIKKGQVELPKSELRGFEHRLASKPDKEKSEAKRTILRANAAKRREELKELAEKRAEYEELKTKLQKEGKL
jgi:hypothetical protein